MIAITQDVHPLAIDELGSVGGGDKLPVYFEVNLGNMKIGGAADEKGNAFGYAETYGAGATGDRWEHHD